MDNQQEQVLDSSREQKQSGALIGIMDAGVALCFAE